MILLTTNIINNIVCFSVPEIWGNISFGIQSCQCLFRWNETIQIGTACCDINSRTLKLIGKIAQFVLWAYFLGNNQQIYLKINSMYIHSYERHYNSYQFIIKYRNTFIHLRTFIRISFKCFLVGTFWRCFDDFYICLQ